MVSHIFLFLFVMTSIVPNLVAQTPNPTTAPSDLAYTPMAERAPIIVLKDDCLIIPPINLDELMKSVFPGCDSTKLVGINIKNKEERLRIFSDICDCQRSARSVTGLAVEFSATNSIHRVDPINANLRNNGRIISFMHYGPDLQVADFLKDPKDAEPYMLDHKAKLNLSKINTSLSERVKRLAPDHAPIELEVPVPGKSVFTGELTNNSCVSMKDYFAFKSFPEENEFYSYLGKTNKFEAKDWDFYQLLDRYKEGMRKEGFTSKIELSVSIREGRGSDRIKDLVSIKQRLDFLMKNPIAMNVFTLDASKYGGIQNDLLQKLKKNLAPSCNKPSKVHCAMDKQSSYEKDMGQFLKDRDVRQVLSKIRQNNSVNFLKVNEQFFNVSSDPIKENSADLLIENQDLTAIGEFCQTVATYEEAKDNGLVNENSALNELVSDWSDNLSLDPENNKGFSRFKSNMCDDLRASKDKKSFDNFDGYLAKKCGTRECTPKQKEQYLKDFLIEYPTNRLENANDNFAYFKSKRNLDRGLDAVGYAETQRMARVKPRKDNFAETYSDISSGRMSRTEVRDVNPGTPSGTSSPSATQTVSQQNLNSEKKTESVSPVSQPASGMVAPSTANFAANANPVAPAQVSNDLNEQLSNATANEARTQSGIQEVERQISSTPIKNPKLNEELETLKEELAANQSKMSKLQRQLQDQNTKKVSDKTNTETPGRKNEQGNPSVASVSQPQATAPQTAQVQAAGMPSFSNGQGSSSLSANETRSGSQNDGPSSGGNINEALRSAQSLQVASQNPLDNSQSNGLQVASADIMNLTPVESLTLPVSKDEYGLILSGNFEKLSSAMDLSKIKTGEVIRVKLTIAGEGFKDVLAVKSGNKLIVYNSRVDRQPAAVAKPTRNVKLNDLQNTLIK